MKKSFCFICFIILSTITVSAQDRGLSQVEIIKSIVGQDVAVGKQWAVFIAIDNYKDKGWFNLRYPVKDARDIRKILEERYIFDEFEELFDEKATARGIRNLFYELQNKVGKDDSVFVFHAGHGQNEKYFDLGYFIPHDGGSDDDLKSGWLSHNDVRKFLDDLPARHVLMISDSCYSGSLIITNRGNVPQFDNVSLQKAYYFISREIMTSGEMEPVPDVSKFALRLKNALSTANELCLDAQRISILVENDETLALYAAMPRSQHQPQGKFLFFRNDISGVRPPVNPPNINPSPVRVYKIGDRGPGRGIIFYVQDGTFMEVSSIIGSCNWNDADRIARNHKGGGFNDWRLPTNVELNTIYQNLCKENLGNIGDGIYWSSSQNSDLVFMQRFSDGMLGLDNKQEKYLVRAVRVFNHN